MVLVNGQVYSINKMTAMAVHSYTTPILDFSFQAVTATPLIWYQIMKGQGQSGYRGWAASSEKLVSHIMRAISVLLLFIIIIIIVYTVGKEARLLKTPEGWIIIIYCRTSLLFVAFWVKMCMCESMHTGFQTARQSCKLDLFYNGTIF